MSKKRLLLPLAAVAGALLVAGCGGSSGGGGDTGGPTSGLTGIILPSGHQLNEDRFTVTRGEHVDLRGVRFSCPVDAEDDCTVILVTRDDALAGDFEGGMAMALDLPDEFYGLVGSDSLGDYLRTLFDTAGAPIIVITAGPDGSLDTVADNITVNAFMDYVAELHTLVSTPGDPDADPVVEDIDNGKIALNHTTHGPDAINDMNATVMPVEKRDDENPAMHIYTGGVEDAEGETVGSPIERSAMFTVTAMWNNDQNEADVWKFEDELDSDPTATGIWTHSLQLSTIQQGGRVVMLDLYSDFNEDEEKPVSEVTPEELMLDVPMVVQAIFDTPGEDDETVRSLHWQFGVVGEGTGSFPAEDEVEIDANIIAFNDPNYVSPDDLELGERQELRPVEDDDQNAETTERAADMVRGTWKGIPGTFHCEMVTAGNGNCFIRNQQGGVTSGGIIQFTPDPGAMVRATDTDWLSAGVWLTLPDDPDGDYAAGAFVHGGEPFHIVEGDANNHTLTEVVGGATYTGTAVGRYAEDRAGTATGGRFRADAVLTADFTNTEEMQADENAGTPFIPATLGSVSGLLSNFSADGQTDPDWDLNFDLAMIGTDGRFGDEVSGHANGHALDGVWAGQFFGNPGLAYPEDDPATIGREDLMPMADDVATLLVNESLERGGHPGAIAGTFGASDRDADDDYELTMVGAFGAPWQEPPEEEE